MFTSVQNRPSVRSNPVRNGAAGPGGQSKGNRGAYAFRLWRESDDLRSTPSDVAEVLADSSIEGTTTLSGESVIVDCPSDQRLHITPAGDQLILQVQSGTVDTPRRHVARGAAHLPREFEKELAAAAAYADAVRLGFDDSPMRTLQRVEFTRGARDFTVEFVTTEHDLDESGAPMTIRSRYDFASGEFTHLSEASHEFEYEADEYFVQELLSTVDGAEDPLMRRAVMEQMLTDYRAHPGALKSHA